MHEHLRDRDGRRDVLRGHRARPPPRRRPPLLGDVSRETSGPGVSRLRSRRVSSRSAQVACASCAPGDAHESRGRSSRSCDAARGADATRTRRRRCATPRAAVGRPRRRRPSPALDARRRCAPRSGIADLGAGAGLPGLVARRGAARGARWRSCESVGRKCAVHRAPPRPMGARQRRRSSTPARRSGRRLGRARRRDGAGARRRCRCCASTPRRCCADGGTLVAWKGAVASRRSARTGRRPPAIARPRAGRGRCAVDAVPGRSATALCTSTRKVAPTPDAVPAPAGNGRQTPAPCERLSARVEPSSRRFGPESAGSALASGAR